MSSDSTSPAADQPVVVVEQPKIKYFSAIAGTWSFDGDEHDQAEWWTDKSPHAEFMIAHGFTPLLIDGDPFIWATRLTGFDWLRYFGKKEKHTEWIAAGYQLKHYLDDVPLADRNVIAHSHGGQVVAYAAMQGLKLNNLITVSMPVRGDMLPVYTAAAKNIGNWTHTHSDKTDYMQVWGALFDGRFGIHRACEQAHRNVTIAHVGHSGILRQPEFFHYWVDEKLLDDLGR